MSLADDVADPHGAFWSCTSAAWPTCTATSPALPQRRHSRGPDRRDVPGRGRAPLQRRQRRACRSPWLIGTARHKLVDHWRRERPPSEALDDL